uniref:EamA domain-containing protein n=1 Tax=Pseudo-nitzschia australis TaxID=44445 RepID=A0A7S4A9L4_9STRA|mmetsp:Transcript_26838/g.58875  ORF Transcript_26838/g.58875 Transcript_26838/m.58875 type:complete len:408 (+) Transcript_26838:183-1406(+)|eukprot:CAMPEP_0168172174 /NCGR_PEP_ID=MMETSP0139_2-20121125/5097_1 /TAXON_ID=44445 /ORGANISM="Pseudo-nitzschia australis, Strain 10249 10 AB" /LENGTH=407 /DNA_ID=CAMNT_0008089775 /DNA_START=136 /DNA_END=1359 /DNA_ORIENTATION=+
MGPGQRSTNDADCDSLVVLQQQHLFDTKNRDGDEMNVSNLLQEFERRREEYPVQQIYGWTALLFGQLVALVATSMNATSYMLEYGMHKVFPMFLLFNSYVILTLHLFWSSSSNKGQAETPRYRLPLTRLKLRSPWYHYLCLSCLDIAPNYFALLAIHQTSLMSATLLQSLTIPSAMIFCRLLLGKKYRWMHYVGVALCMLGGGITVITDKGDIWSSDGETSHPHTYSGDILAVLAALLYGIGDSCAEFWSKHVNREEYLGMIGLFGAIWTLIASLVYERDAVVEALNVDDEAFFRIVGVMVWYIASLAGYYIVESAFLMKSDATLLNLSLQTQNFWAIIFSVLAFKEKPDLPFYFAISSVVAGVFVYELCENDDTAIRLERLKKIDDIETESTPLNRTGHISCENIE